MRSMSESELVIQTFRRIHVRDCQGVLWAFLRAYQDQGFLSLEGDLSQLCLLEFSNSSNVESGYLKRQTIEPELDFTILPLTLENISALKMHLSKPGFLGKKGMVVHVQIATHAGCVFVACDNFHPECTVVSSDVPDSFLDEQKKSGVLKDFERITST